ncbi:flagellar assembly protein FliH [Variovorax sp. OK605]|jgi:flagellar assembly protein FliH|uniref:flagellar assembly protein FliH n=1 Tax=unclassified Variovorax TaxID=663243 RepID=UPI0008AE4684|nr:MULTISPECIES: flagellar assembly protein FliH [unclassified Variovorax]SEK16923.1 flagellar assembly protein FliH [Variovorax sp. OK202]SFE64604.1 flagellar assembly protein FliH [Variovorax sp. OK212]SFQ20455.1 flagellar assembly protein FliH [Variovorax sp. OK605]
MTLSDPRSYGGANGTNANVNDASALFGGSPERLAAIHAAARQAAAGPKPVLSAWERWEMGTLDGRPPSASRKAASAARTAVPVPPPAPPAPKIDLAELARIRKDARAAGEAEGRADGLAEGRKAGHTEGLATGLAAATVHAERLRALTRSFPDALRRAEGELADTVLALALDVARQVVHRTLTAEPAWVLPLVRDLLNTEPALRGEPRLLLHPEDVALVKNSLGHEIEAAGWQVRADDTLTRGGCRVQSANGELDGTLETRWKRVSSALRDGTESA